jgi:prephenate dehydrogenase
VAFWIEKRPANLDTRAVRWQKVTLIGVGLLGGSLGLALRQRRLAGRVVGYVRRPASVAECVQAGAVDEATLDLAEAVAEADLVIFCTPIAQMLPLAKQMLPSLKRGAIVTDVGSVKASVLRDLEAMLAAAGAHLVGSHPMAGAEKTGVSAARANLFDQAVCIVTPTRRTQARALRAVEQLWKKVGSRVLRIEAERHDELVSRSSHLPHLVAAGLASFVLDPEHPKEQALLCATGFRDTTRIASGSSEMWRDIALANRQHLGASLGRFIKEMQGIQRLIRRGRPDAIDQFFKTAKSRRDEWQKRAAPVSPE